MPSQLVRRAVLFVALAALTLAFAGTASAATYVVLYKAQGLPADGGASVRAAGGTVVASYPQIGVLIASSDSAGFRAALAKDNRVDGVSTTAGSSRTRPRARKETCRTRRPRTLTRFPGCNGTCARSIRRKPMRLPVVVLRCS